MKQTEEINIARLIMNSARLVACRTDRAMETFGLYRGQAIALHILANHDGLTHSELAERLEISPAATTKVIKRLEEKKFLERRPDPADDRLSRVFLKEDGWTVTRHIREVFQQNNRILQNGFTPDELSTLISLLTRVRENARHLPEGTV